MNTVKVIYLKNDSGKVWASLLIDNISIAEQAVQDIVGGTISGINLNDHAIYDKGTFLSKIVGFGTAREVFKHICEMMYDDRPVVMNMKGGYIQQDVMDWEVVEIKTFTFKSWRDANFLELLKRENGIVEVFEEIPSE